MPHAATPPVNDSDSRRIGFLNMRPPFGANRQTKHY
jgi:hypothetical protein